MIKCTVLILLTHYDVTMLTFKKNINIMFSRHSDLKSVNFRERLDHLQILSEKKNDLK